MIWVLEIGLIKKLKNPKNKIKLLEENQNYEHAQDELLKEKIKLIDLYQKRITDSDCEVIENLK